jgi:signal peptidase I
MTSESGIAGGFCRIYSLLVLAYPREFRRDYRRPMEQLFRDRCRDLARAGGSRPMVLFALRTLADWFRTAIREHASALWSAGHNGERRGFAAEWAATILVYLFAATTVVQAYVIPTGSMEGNLLVGDHILVDRTAYADPGTFGRNFLPYRDVQRGDIVAFLYPEDVRQTYVKRVIGLPGDRIRLEHGQVVRNGKRLAEPYTRHIAASRDEYRDEFPTSPEGSTTLRGREMFERHIRGGEVVVPPDRLFVLGDNRDNSADSRYWGFVPRSYVVGKPALVYWSYDAPTADLQGWSVEHAVDVALHFFTRTRWNRTLLVPHSQRAAETGAAQ